MIIPGLRALVRAALPKQPPAPKEVEASLAAARAAIAEAEAAVRVAEQSVVRATLGGEADEAVTAAHAALEEARKALKRREETVQLLEAQLVEVQERDAAARRATAIARATKLLDERVKLGQQLDDRLRALAETIDDLHAVNVQILNALPEKPSDIPACFRPEEAQRWIALRMFALTQGGWAPEKRGLYSPFTAGELPTLSTRLAAERKQLLSQYGVHEAEAA